MPPIPQKIEAHPAIDKPDWLPLVFELVRTYQAFETRGSAHVRTLGVTPAQFDVLATLGNTDGMSCKELGERTLITKGTLTGILDRMQQKGLLTRAASPTDGRSVIVRLSPKGDACFRDVFPNHLKYMDEYFGQLGSKDRQTLLNGLIALRRALSGDTLP